MSRCSDPVSPDGQRVSRVHVPLPVISRLPVPKDLHLEVPHHGVHHLPVRHTHLMVKGLRHSHTDLCWLPVDPSRTFLRLDLDVVVVYVDLRDLHLEVVGKEPDGFPHRAEAGTPRRLEQRGRCGRACGEEEEEGLVIIRQTLHRVVITETGSKQKHYILGGNVGTTVHLNKRSIILTSSDRGRGLTGLQTNKINPVSTRTTTHPQNQLQDVTIHLSTKLNV